MPFFFKDIMFSCLFQKISKTNENSNSNQVGRQNLRCNYTKFQLEISIAVLYMCLIYQEYPYFTIFTIRTIVNKTGDLLKSVKPCVSSLQM